MSGSSIAAEGALATVTIAAFLIPAAWPLVAEMFEDQNDPEAIWTAGMKWIDQANELGTASSTGQGIVGAMPQSEWKGKDRTAFEQKMGDYEAQIMFARIFAYVVGAAMLLLAVMIF